ncbi:ABC transporter permease subunit [Nocardioides sp. ChNu-153]|uniref:ABC transporter permease n=1 Tax=unclassified Nocardioides TaxID=2615069 RepID=UPI0024067883|nr:MULTISPECIES: ABC transporter permease subunit [unclassified Nocardioides]MDF9717739.1 ABC transporter permease subunit [Nocardioides sp. ChNu-99]MDN7120185.1 ABC transporter permease subunit [Nocardioides sp. ChNu-153]
MSATLTPPHADTGPEQQPVRSRTGLAVLRSVGRTLVTMTFVLAVVVGLWVAGLALWDVDDFVGKGPADVWAHLVTDPDAAENRDGMLGLLLVTLEDAATGFVVGLVAAVVLALLIVRFRAVESAVMPVAMVLRSVPLVALAPIIILLAGRGFLTVAFISGVVVLFPALVTVVFGLRSVSPQLRDVVTVYGGSEGTVLRRAALPAALPSLFAAIRISVPGAITGALLAEWLATGQGMGSAIVSASRNGRINETWSLVVIVTVASLVLYLVAQLVESVVLARYGDDAGRGR